MVLQQRVADNLARVESAICEATAGRKVTLVCVTKYAPLEHAAALVEAGAQHLGENLLPAGAQKFEALRRQGLSFSAHMLGPLQSRKARICAQSCDWYQALERVEIAANLQAELEALDRSLDVLIQVHVGEEATKHGVDPADLDRFIEELVGEGLVPSRSDEYTASRSPTSAGGDKIPPYKLGGRLRIRGLMCIPPGPSSFLSPKVYEAATRDNFRQIAALFARMQAGYPELPVDTLSMGMSGDYRWAIEEGATMVRIGRALFEGLDGL